MKRLFRFLIAEILWIIFKVVALYSKHFLLPRKQIQTNTPNQFEYYEADKYVPIPMRDGVNLYADIYKPPAEGRYPVILIRLPYGIREFYTYMPAYGRYWAKKGYIFIAQDVRGKWRSEGEFEPMVNESQDGYDTIDWIADQSWCDGNIGMMGESYYSYTQWAAAITNHPNLKCFAPMNMNVDIHSLAFPGGALSLQLIGGWIAEQHTKTFRNLLRLNYWHLPLASMADEANLSSHFFSDFFNHLVKDSYWDKFSLSQYYGEVKIPGLHIGGWYDPFLDGVLDGWVGLKENANSPFVRENQWLLIAPIDHEKTQMETGKIGKLSIEGKDWDSAWLFDRHQQFYDYWLKGIKNNWDERPKVEIFVIGDNEWRFEEEWPLRQASYIKYYFHSHGKANTRSGTGILNTKLPKDEPADRFDYDPNNPVAIALETDYWSLGQYLKDRQWVEDRQDVLVYTFPSFEEEIEITGPIHVTLFASSSTKDTDFTATLVDVFPGGNCHLIQEGIIRARYRDSDAHPTLIEPGEIYEYTIDLWATSFVIKPGHNLRVEISSSNFNRFDRNLNTGKDIGLDDEVLIARQTIYHNQQYPSNITLPIIPRN
jgi:putative CocE/NonD family hydrolase